VSASIEAVGKDDIIRISHALLKRKNITLTTLGPQKKLPSYEKIQGWLG
jgi:predicted Zn-dependent peptidase